MTHTVDMKNVTELANKITKVCVGADAPTVALAFSMVIFKQGHHSGHVCEAEMIILDNIEESSVH